MKRTNRPFCKHSPLVVTIVVVTTAAISMNVVTAKVLFGIAYTERGYAAVGSEWILAFMLCVSEWQLVFWCSRTFWKRVKGSGKHDV